ncbi:MAG TPA: LysR substrate-binding domain-containing protein, partial [Bordetella sp.]
STRQAIEAAFDAHGIKPQATLEIGSREMICRAVRHNLGCTLMPIGDVSQDGDLRQVSIAPEAPILHVYLYCLRARAEMPMTEAFIASLPDRRKAAPTKA